MAETWVIKNDAPVDEASRTLATTNVSFTTNNQKATSIGIIQDGGAIVLIYGGIGEVAGLDPGGSVDFEWINDAYKTLVFDSAPTSGLLAWLQANGTKQTKPANKVIIANETIIDLTQDTVTADKLVSGVTAHDKSGVRIMGTMGPLSTMAYNTNEITLSGNNVIIPAVNNGDTAFVEGEGEQVVDVLVSRGVFGTATADKVLKGNTFSSLDGITQTGTMPNNGSASIQLSDLTAKSVTAGYYSGGTAKIADTEAAKIIPENIKKGVTILGVEGTMEAGGPYDVTSTTNSDGTQNLAITDAGGSSGGSGLETATITITFSGYGSNSVSLGWANVDTNGNLQPYSQYTQGIQTCTMTVPINSAVVCVFPNNAYNIGKNNINCTSVADMNIVTICVTGDNASITIREDS